MIRAGYDEGIMASSPGRGEFERFCPVGAAQEGSPLERQAQNIQEAFLNNARKDKTFLTIYLMSGVKLSGRIKSFDKYSVILETNNQEQLIFKHAISTVVVSRPFHTGAPSAAWHRSACRARRTGRAAAPSYDASCRALSPLLHSRGLEPVFRAESTLKCGSKASHPRLKSRYWWAST